MNATFKAEYPNEIKFTLTATMNLGEWKKVKEILGESSYGHELWYAISTMIQMAEQTYKPSETISDQT